MPSAVASTAACSSDKERSRRSSTGSGESAMVTSVRALQAHPEPGAAVLARLITNAPTPSLDRDSAKVQTQAAVGHHAVPAQRERSEQSRQTLERHRIAL